MVVSNSGFTHQLLQQHLAETSRMSHRQTNVFVEMKSLYLPPVDPRGLGQSIQKFELRRCRRSNDPRLATLSDCSANGHRRLFRGRLPQRQSITEYFHQHAECSGWRRRTAPLRLSQLYKERGHNRRWFEPEFHSVKAASVAHGRSASI